MRCERVHPGLLISNFVFSHLTSKVTTDWGHAGSGEFPHLVPPRCWKSIKYHLNPGQRWKSHAPCRRALRVLQESQKIRSPPLSWATSPGSTSPPKPSSLSTRCADRRLVCTTVQLNVVIEPHHLHPRPPSWATSFPSRSGYLSMWSSRPDSQIGLPASF